MKITCLGSSSVEGIGDSKGLGWVGRINQELQKETGINQYRLFNLGIKGEFLECTIKRYELEVKRRRPHLVIIFAGINDCITHIKDGQRLKYPRIKEYNKKWHDFLQHIRFAEHKTIILGPTLANEEKSIKNYKGSEIIFRNEDLRQYNSTLKHLCSVYNVDYLELMDLFEDDIDGCTSDFIHPNTKGYDMLADRILNKLKEGKYVDI